MRHPRSCPTPRELVSNPMACISDHTGPSDCWSDDSTERPAQAVRLRLYSDLTSECKQAQFAGIPWFHPRECQFSLRSQATAVILLVFGDFAGQKEILEQDRGLSLYCFFWGTTPPLRRRSTCFCCLLGCFGGFFDHLNTFSNPSHDRYGHAVA